MALTSVTPRAGGFLVSEAESYRGREKIIILSGENVVAGHVLGKVLVGGSVAGAAASGNAGDGTIGTLTLGSARLGTYQAVITEPGANVGEFEVRDPDGITVGQGTVAAAYAGAGPNFTIADGATDFATGDRFIITVSGGTEKYKEYDPTNTDGSEVPAAISWDFYDATLADVVGTGIVRDAQVNTGELTWFTGATTAQKTAALALMAREPMRVIGRAAV